jgi:putative peptidoglycan lipid II flippase
MMLFRRQTLHSAVFVLFSMTLANNLLGFVRELLVARQFGATRIYDVYIVAQYIPGLIYNALILGLPNLFIPLIFEVREHENEEQANIFQRSFFVLWFLILLFILIIIYFLIPFLTTTIIPLSSKSEFNEASRISRILTIGITFAIPYSLLKSISNAHNYFTVPAILSLLQNLSLIAFVVWGSQVLSINALVAGTIFGFLLQTIIQIFFTKGNIFSLAGPYAFKSKEIYKSLWLFAPIIAYEFLIGIYYLLDGIFSIQLSAGDASIYNYAIVLSRIPSLLIGMSIASALLPNVSEAAIKKDYTSIRERIHRIISFIAVLTIPLTGSTILLGTYFINLFYRGGAFNPGVANATSTILSSLSVGFFAMTLLPVTARALNALNLSKWLFIIVALGIGLKSILCAIFLKSFGLQTIAYASNISILLVVIFNLTALHFRIGGIFAADWLKKIILLSITCLGSILIGMFIHAIIGIIVLLLISLIIGKNDLLSVFRTLSVEL